MPSLNLTDAWKDYTPPSPPDTAGQTAADTPPAAPAPGARTSFFLSPETTGLLAPGNIDLRSRPVIHNPDGTVSTPRTLSIARDGRQYLIPTVSDEGELLSDQDAITRFEQTGRHLGAFKTLQDATGYANQLHRQQEILYAASPEDFQGWEIQNRPPVSDFPGQAATPLSPARPRTLFDQPLTTPLIPSSTRPAPAFQPDPQRLEQLHALILHSKQDPELDALLETNPAFRAQADLDDGSLPSRALLGQQILREIAGDKYAGEPGFYFLALKEKLPEAATRQEAYAAVYDHYAKAIEKQYQENKTRKAAYQKNRTEVEGAVAKVIGSLWTPADLNTRLTPEQTDVYRKEFDTAAVEKAHAAFSILKQAFSATPEEGLRRMVSERTAMQITSALSDNDGTGKLTISETAFGLFEGALHTLMEETKEQSGDEYKFLHNLRLALFSPVIKRDATLGTLLQINSQQNNLIPFAHEHNDKVLEKTEETLRDYQTYLKNDKENARVLGLLSTGQDLGNSPNERAPFAARTVNCLGSVCGQTAPFFIPYAGWGLALTGAYDDKRNRAYYAGLASGTAEWSAFIDAAASTAVEKISYGALGRLSGAGWLMSKLPFMGRTRKALTDSLWKHVLFETGAGIVEETFIEPTAEAVIQWAVRGGIAPLAGIDAGADYDWNNYWQELKGMLEPDQLLATALFVGGLAGTQSAIMQRSLITHSRSPEMLMSQGIPEAEAKRITQIPDNGERIAAVRNAVARLKTRPPAEVLKNAKKGVKAFQSLAEIRATVESEAYQYFQSAMHLPLVEEKLDKPGTYAVTIFDPHSGQKKFTQEMTGAQLTAHFGQYLKSEQRKIIAKAQSDFAANAFMRTSEAHGAIQTQDMLQWSRQDQENAPKEPESATKKPENKKDSPAPTPASDNPPATQTAPAQTPPAPDTVQETSPPSTATDSSPATAHTDSPAPSENLSALGRFIRTFGSMGQTGFSYLTRVALEEWNRRLASGLSREQAGAASFAPLSPYAPLNTMLGLEEAFKKRLGIAAGTTGEEKNNQTGLFQMRTAPGTTPADILFLVSKGLVGTREMLEDLFEVGIKNLVKGEPARLEAMGALLRDTQAGLQKLGFPGQFIAPSGPLDEMKVVEAMSKLALSDTLVNAESLPLPQWQKDLLQYHVNYLQDAAWLLDLGHAWNLGREKGTITQDMADILRDLGHIVHTMYDQAKIEQQDIQAVMEARTLTGRLDASGTPAASEIRERQQKDAEEEKNRITTGDRSKERPLPQTALQRPETLTLPQAPATMKGVFVNGASYNPDAGTWLGMVPVDKLHLSPQVPQVKVNSGKKGVVTPLVGDYRADAPPIYVWKRTTGRLEVVSGRHRLDLAQRTGIKAIPAYVYEEDSTHNAQWARLLDYEQNMQDDQADELTAAIYVRETSLTDDELTRRGLTRSGTRSRRGLLIGREAREDLWTRFRSGAITAQNAEAICLLTQHIQDKARIDAMQTTAANDLANGKTLEFVAAKLQLMAHASADGGMVQGLITFGDTFEADMEKAAEYVSRCITTINEHINAIKGVRTISKKGSVLATEGITAGLSADPAERLRELELLKAMYEKIGLYENLRIRALTWDGKTPPDPIGDHRLDMQAERARAEEDAAAMENEENRKASEALTPKLTFSLEPSYFQQDSLQNEHETQQSIHATSGTSSFIERSLLPRTGESHPGSGHSDEPAGRENSGTDQGLQAGNNQTGPALPGKKPRRKTNAAHSGQLDPAMGVLGIKAYTLSPHLKEQAARNHFYTGDIIEIENSEEGAAHFRRCLEEAKSSQIPYGECVYTYDTEEYQHMRLFLLPGGKAGFALKDGDMVSVFSHKQHGHEGRPSYTLIALAVQMGATKGDCYGTILPDLYAQFGFRAIARDRFNMEFAPESMQQPGHMERWYKAQDSKPDVVYMAYEGNRKKVVEKFNPNAESGFKTLPYSDFDACLQLQSLAVEKQRLKEHPSLSPTPTPDASPANPPNHPSSIIPRTSQGSSFSLTSLHQIVSTLTAPSLQATRAAELVKDFDKAAENWKRVMSGKQDRPSARIGAELFGTINALLSSARYVLPPGYRSQVDMQMQWASIYAAMAESGEIPPKGTLRTGEVFYENFERSMINQTTTAATEQEVRETLAAIGGQRLDYVMSKILDRVRGQLIYFAKDELFRKTMKRVEAVYPKKEPGRKSPRGRMEAQAYRTLARCRQMLAANAREKAEAMTALEALYNKEEDEDKQQEYEQDLLAWKTYGDYKSMSLPQAQEAMKKLLEFLLAGRNSWDHKLKKERGGAKFQARQIQKNLPEANSTSTRAGAKIEHHTKLRKLLASLPYSFMSYAQLMLALEPILGQRFSRARIREITEANAALLNASNDRSAWLFKTIARITGVKSESAAEQWMVRFNKPENTKIPLVPVLTVKITLPIEEAQAWLTLTREERDARRQEIRAEDQRTETLTENVPEEEDILHLRMALDEYERRSPARRQYQQNITSQREVPNKAGSGPLICSRDCALYALLLHEQPDYADVYDDEGVLIRKGFLRREGLDDAGIAALYDYVGPDGLEYGYALRKRLNETGQTLAQIYEQRMGVPFTLKEKYFRATFDRNSTKEKDTLAEPRTGAIGGGKYGLLIDRVVHSENLDLSKSGTLVFLAAAAEQDNYIYTSHITTAWRALLKDKTLEQKLKQRLGEDMLGKLASWMDLIDGASLENNRAFLNLSRMQGMLQRAFAFSVLAGNGYVLLKQSTAILHGFFAGWVPSAVLERADGARELAHRHISASSYLFHLAASKLGLGDISLAEVAATPYFTARMRGAGAMLAQIGNQMPGQRYSRLEKLPEKAMDLIETVDVKANLLSMHALANAYYAHARALNKANDTPFTDTELREAALRQVGMTLELGAQPLTKTQKSMNQAAGGILSKLAFVMKSEQLNKIGLMAAEWKTGSARNRVCAAQSWLALGVTSSLLAWLIAWIKGMDDEDDKEKKWKKYAATALLGDLTTIPLAGEGVNYLASLITGERVFADSYARSLIDVQGVARTVKKEYEHVSDKKEMDWDTHFNNLTSLARAAGVGGAFSRSPSAILSSYGALSLSAATGANISRTAKDLLTTLFRNEDEDRKKKKKKRKRSPKKQ